MIAHPALSGEPAAQEEARMSRTEAPLPRLAGPGGIAELSELMARAHSQNRTVAVFGAGTAFDDHRPAATPGLLIDMSGLAEVVEHDPEGGTLIAGAGAKIADLDALVAQAGQELTPDLPADRTEAGSSLGGAIATAARGPRSGGRAGLRDAVLGVRAVLADGTITRSTHALDESLSGWDLSSLLIGSWGTLGIIAAAEIRLSPRPEASGYVWIPGAEAAAELRVSRLAPAAIELERPPGSPVATVALIEGDEAHVEDGLNWITEHYAGATVCARPAWWARRAQVPVIVRVSASPDFVPTLIRLLARLEDTIGYPLQLRGSAAGVVDLGVGAPDTEPAIATRVVLEHLRTWGLHNLGARLLRAPASVWDEVDAWGPLPGIALRASIKDRLDTKHLLAPGRGLGGI